jgi:response regulator RpfG family c-di-GMP phosphodiesterase
MENDPTANTGAGPGGKTILFVDDEQPVLNALGRVFAETDARCLFAGSADEAMRIVARETVWVVVSDNNMPGMSGIDFLAWLRGASPDTVRILLTAFADLATALAAINRSEAFRFVTKPWNNDELLDVVEEGLNRYLFLSSMRSGNEARYRSLAQTVELKDPYTRGHCDRVAEVACSLARAAGLPEPMIAHIRNGSILHDCGKIGVPEAILNFEGRLSPADFEVVKRHPGWGSEVALQARLPEVVVNVILYHHEQFAGGGYPSGLAGEAIPIEARIAAIADVYDALATDRPYRKGFPPERVLSILDEMTATHFDPVLMALFREKVLPGIAG